MPNNSTLETREDAAKELLLKDLDHLQESFWKNEERGETRVTFFTTLVTAVITALATIIGTERMTDGLPRKILIYYALFSLFLIGVVTLLRLIRRNEVTDGYKKDMDDIRDRFKKNYDSQGVLFKYSPFKPKDKTLSFPYKYKNKQPLRKFGGLAYTVAIINSVILSAIVALALFSYSNDNLAVNLAGTAIIFMASFYFQILYIRYREGEHKKDLNNRSSFTHAGGVVVRFDDRQTSLFLLVSAIKNSAHWVFPKGHIKPNESNEKTAVREVWEEAGVVTSVVGRLGVTQFSSEGELIITEYYLLEYIDEKESPEKREKHWCDYEKGNELLSFKDIKQLLYKANCIASKLTQ